MNLHGFGHLLVEGTFVTLQLAFAGLSLGLVLGLLGALASLAPLAPLRWAANTWNTLLRGLPELLLVLLLFYGSSIVIERLTGVHVEVSAFAAGVIALGLAFGAYASEVFRSALLEIPRGQREAGLALGLSRTQVFFSIELPQLWRIALPGLGNLFLVLLKDTALVSVVGLDDLMRQAYVAVGYTKLPFTFYLAAAGIYLLLTIIAMQVIGQLERLANRGIPREVRT